MASDDEIVVLEAGDRIGGSCTDRAAGHSYDTGAEAVLARVPEAVALVEALGLADEPWSRRRCRLPSSCRTVGTVARGDGARCAGLRGGPGRAALSDGVARVRAEADLPPLRFDGDVAVGALLRARPGDEVVDQLVEPLLGGVYAGGPDELSLLATMPALAAELPERRRYWLPRRPLGRRGPAGGATTTWPVFRTVRSGSARCRGCWWSRPRGRTCGCAPAHGSRRAGSGFELVGSARPPRPSC